MPCSVRSASERIHDCNRNISDRAVLRAGTADAPSRSAPLWRASSKASERSCIPALRWLEVLTYKVIGVREDVEQRWTQYTASLLSFSIFGFLLVYLLQRAQGFLPFNPQHFNAGNVTPDLAFNTAASFSPTRTGRTTAGNRPSATSSRWPR